MGDFGSRLEEVLRRRGWEQQRLAAELGIRPATISAWKTSGSLPAGATLLQLAGALEVDLHWLMTGEYFEREDATVAERKLAAIRRILDGEVPATAGGGAGGPNDAYEDVLQVTAKRRREKPRQEPGEDESLPGAG